MTTHTTHMTAARRRSRNPTTEAQLLDSWAWLDGVTNTPTAPAYEDFSADFVLATDWDSAVQHPMQSLLLDPPLFPPSAAAVVADPSLFSLNGSPFDTFSPSQSQSLSQSPSSSTTLDADSLRSFEPTETAAQPLSDAEFQLLLDGLSQEDTDAMAMMPVCEPFVPMASLTPAVDDFLLHAFPSLDMYSSMDGAELPVSVPVPAPVPVPVPDAPAMEQSVRCRTCHRAYPTLCRLRKHERTHTRPFSCDVCHKGHAAKKDLHRHLWTTHPEAAAQMGIPSPMRVCPVAGCGYEARQDNLRRHIGTKHSAEFA